MASVVKSFLVCLECGHHWAKRVTGGEVTCPKCGGCDIDIDGYWDYSAAVRNLRTLVKVAKKARAK